MSTVNRKTYIRVIAKATNEKQLYKMMHLKPIQIKWNSKNFQITRGKAEKRKQKQTNKPE